MIFKPRMIEAIVEGRKFETRRPCNGPCPYVVGRTYAVQPGRGKKAVGRIYVWDVEPQHLDQITEVDARAEGFANRQDFMAYWKQLYGHVDAEQQVYVIRFQKMPDVGWTSA